MKELFDLFSIFFVGLVLFFLLVVVSPTQGMETALALFAVVIVLAIVAIVVEWRKGS